ncbi:hypothetical protein DEO72_LG3g1137 [Vigna unguiculata]|uniref:Uncharacterized protein n=1 Tax=Vigna unguiculata TaxID=3917 RepID=A0A4D6LDQ6_VIGUN|nr:hypothetical protein DEO72_LG3g1137 [Vigna unguiculata]
MAATTRSVIPHLLGTSPSKSKGLPFFRDQSLLQRVTNPSFLFSSARILSPSIAITSLKPSMTSILVEPSLVLRPPSSSILYPTRAKP